MRGKTQIDKRVCLIYFIKEGEYSYFDVFQVIMFDKAYCMKYLIVGILYKRRFLR